MQGNRKSADMLTMDSLELGMILWESIPEQDKVAQRQVTTYGRMQDLRGDKVKEWLYIRVDGGFMGLGEQLVADDQVLRDSGGGGRGLPYPSRKVRGGSSAADRARGG